MSTVARTGVMPIPPPGHDHSVAFSPDGSKIVGTAAGGIHLWDADTRMMREFMQGHFNSVTFSPNGSKIVGTDYRGIRVWDADTGMMADSQ
jgi:WD40 repeat protein